MTFLSNISTYKRMGIQLIKVQEKWSKTKINLRCKDKSITNKIFERWFTKEQCWQNK